MNDSAAQADNVIPLKPKTKGRGRPKKDKRRRPAINEQHTLGYSKWYNGQTSFPHWVLTLDLPPIEKLVLMRYKSSAYGNKNEAFPKIKTVASDLKVSVDTIKRAIKALEEKHYLYRDPRPGYADWFVVCFPEETDLGPVIPAEVYSKLEDPQRRERAATELVREFKSHFWNHMKSKYQGNDADDAAKMLRCTEELQSYEMDGGLAIMKRYIKRWFNETYFSSSADCTISEFIEDTMPSFGKNDDAAEKEDDIHF